MSVVFRLKINHDFQCALVLGLLAMIQTNIYVYALSYQASAVDASSYVSLCILHSYIILSISAPSDPSSLRVQPILNSNVQILNMLRSSPYRFCSCFILPYEFYSCSFFVLSWRVLFKGFILPCECCLCFPLPDEFCSCFLFLTSFVHASSFLLSYAHVSSFPY
jgi:hypothetical protein